MVSGVLVMIVKIRGSGWDQVRVKVSESWFDVLLHGRATLLIQRANRFAVRIMITSTKDAAQASSFCAS
jgi:hypothetical protein